jgi:hypothetical protein
MLYSTLQRSFIGIRVQFTFEYQACYAWSELAQKDIRKSCQLSAHYLYHFYCWRVHLQICLIYDPTACASLLPILYLRQINIPESFPVGYIYFNFVDLSLSSLMWPWKIFWQTAVVCSVTTKDKKKNHFSANADSSIPSVHVRNSSNFMVLLTPESPTLIMLQCFPSNFSSKFGFHFKCCLDNNSPCLHVKNQFSTSL